MTREEHIYQLKQYLQGMSISMCPASSLYWQEHWEEVIKALEQEPKPMVEIDLYSVIKQKYIEREVLDKIRAEINKNIEQEDFARSVFINKEKDYSKANQCTGNLQAYEKVLDMIDNLLKENEDV